MKRLLLLLTLATVLNAGAQDNGSHGSLSGSGCSSAAVDAAREYMESMNADRPDSVSVKIKNWEAHCGLNEAVYRAKLLYHMKFLTFDNSMLNSSTMDFIISFQDRLYIMETGENYYYEDDRAYYSYIPPGGGFDDYTMALAGELMMLYEPGSTEYLLAEFYSGRAGHISDDIQAGKYAGTELHDDYYRRVARYRDISETHYSFIAGAWIPMGELKAVGIHPEIGFQVGTKRKRMNYDFTLSFKFVNSSEPYLMKQRKTDNYYNTKHFVGYNIGFDLGYDLFRSRKGAHEFQLIGGVALDGFDTLLSTEEDPVEGISALSYNLNAGIGYRLYLSDKLYIGLRMKYNFVDYTLNKVVDYRGNVVTVQFVVGGLENPSRDKKLSALGYNGPWR